MSYWVSITRKPNPTWSGGERISESEWCSVADSDPEFRRPTEAEVASACVRVSAYDLIWTRHPTCPSVWFTWLDGQIEVKNPDDVMLSKMANIAAKLGARLISETGETFDASGKSLGLDELPEEPPQ